MDDGSGGHPAAHHSLQCRHQRLAGSGIKARGRLVCRQADGSWEMNARAGAGAPVFEARKGCSGRACSKVLPNQTAPALNRHQHSAARSQGHHRRAHFNCPHPGRAGRGLQPVQAPR